MGDQSSFQFGVEIELLLGSRKKSYSSWSSLAKDVSKRLSKAGINNHINESNSKSYDNYREWSIVQEVTIPSQPAKNLCDYPPDSLHGAFVGRPGRSELSKRTDLWESKKSPRQRMPEETADLSLGGYIAEANLQ